MAQKRKPRKYNKSRDNRKNVPESRDVDRGESSSNHAMSSLNDLSWYTRNPLLTEAAARLPYPNKPGMRIKLGAPAGVNPAVYTMPVPAVMALDWVPSVGTANAATDPVNIVAREMYAKIRKAYSGTLSVDPNDLIIYLMSLDSIYIYLGYWKRVYRFISQYSSMNMAFPSAFLHAMGFTDDQILELQANKTLLWQYINELVYMSHQLTSPAVMDIFNRHYWMSDNVYTDAPSPKAQMYMFNAISVFQFNENSSSGSSLTMTSVIPSTAAGKTIVDLFYEQGLNLLQRLTGSEDAYTINGYLQRAYEGVPVFAVQPLLQDEYITPVYVPEVLKQIENSQALPLASLPSRSANYKLVNTVTQNPATGDVVSNPQIGKSDFLSTFDVSGVVLSSRMDMPDVAENVIISRLKSKVDLTNNVGTASNPAYPIICGTEIPVAWWICLPSMSTTGESYLLVHVPKWHAVASDPTEAFTVAQAREMYASYMVSAFDWHPISFFRFTGSGAGGTSVMDTFGNVAPIGDIHNITVITQDDLYNLHKVCIYSEFNAFSTQG